VARTTIHDVAAEAGVSLATVDRVLNGRTGVRDATARKVEDAIQRLNYKRDEFAKSLATQKEYHFTFILPDTTSTFIKYIHREVMAAVEPALERRIFLKVRESGSFDEEASVKALLEEGRAGCDGIAVVAPDHPSVKEAIDGLVARGIPVVTLVSDVPTSRRFQCVGINNTAAGRVAGTLLGRFVGKEPGPVAIVAGSLILRDHADRWFGFKQVLDRDHPHLTLLPVLEGRDDSDITVWMLQEVLNRHPDLKGIYSAGAGNRGIIQALEESGRAGGVVVIAHELTSHARKALISGTFDAVINQDPADEVRTAVTLLKNLVDRGAAVQPMPQIGLSIYFRDNLP
jgi:LacI family transcriptional regulator